MTLLNTRLNFSIISTCKLDVSERFLCLRIVEKSLGSHFSGMAYNDKWKPKRLNVCMCELLHLLCIGFYDDTEVTTRYRKMRQFLDSHTVCTVGLKQNTKPC